MCRMMREVVPVEFDLQLRGCRSVAKYTCVPVVTEYGLQGAVMVAMMVEDNERFERTEAGVYF